MLYKEYLKMNAMTEHKAILKIFGSDLDKNQNRGCRMTNISKFLQIWTKAISQHRQNLCGFCQISRNFAIYRYGF